MNEITNDNALKNLGKQIAESVPALADLSETQLKEVASWYLKKRLTDDMETLVKSSSIDLDLSRTFFLASFDSIHTKKSYLASLNRLESFCKKQNKDLISMTPALADQWILSERQSGRAVASVRKDVAVASSFFSFLERQHNMKNIFRGTKARPKITSSRQLKIPDLQDFQIVINNTPKQLSAIIHLMGVTGLRSGAFENLSFYDNVIRTISKGKELKMNVSDAVVNIVKDAGLPLFLPFVTWKAYKIENLLRYYTNKLYTAGRIKDVYSAHDFRHYFARQEYSTNKDIYRLSKLLNHSSIQTTQIYLRSLNFDI